jgi:hypothetical protein
MVEDEEEEEEELIFSMPSTRSIAIKIFVIHRGTSWN